MGYEKSGPHFCNARRAVNHTPLILSYTSFISNVNSVNEVHGKEQTEFQLNNFFIIVI